MAEFNEKELNAHIKKGDFLPAYFITGDEEYLKKLYCDKLVTAAVGDDASGFNLDRFDSKSGDIAKILDACDLMPMMNDRRCVLVEDIKLESISESELELLNGYFINPPEFTVLIFYQSGDALSAKAKKVVDLFRKLGAVCTISKRKGKELTKPLISSATKQKCVLSESVANYLISVCGDDYNTLLNEVSKLCHFVGEGEITKKHIDEVAVKTDDAKVYFLTKALISKDFNKAYDTLASLLRQKTEPEYILGTIISTYVDIYRARVSVACSQSAEALATDFGYRNNAFRLSNAARDSRGMSIESIRKCLEELYNADRKLKFSRDSATVIFEQLMVRLFLIANGEKV